MCRIVGSLGFLLAQIREAVSSYHHFGKNEIKIIGTWLWCGNTAYASLPHHAHVNQPITFLTHAGTKAVLDRRQNFFKIPYCGKTFSIFYLLFLVYKYSIISCIGLNNVIVVYPVKYYDIAPGFPHWFDIYQSGDVHNVGISHSWINISIYWNHWIHINQSGISFGSISIII